MSEIPAQTTHYTVCVEERLPRKPYYARVEDDGEYGFWATSLEAHVWVRENCGQDTVYLVPVAFEALCGESEALP